MTTRLAGFLACVPLLAAPTSFAHRDLAPAPAHTASADTAWVRHCAIYEVFVTDFSPSGDFQGLIRGLGRIQALGTNVIWLMPIQPLGVLNHKGTLGSPYAIRDYLAIDSAFGTPADFRALVRAVHERGMKIIIDWVPDHTSWDNVWVTQHPDYYVRDAHGNLTVPIDPQGHPTNWSDVVQLDYHNPALRAAMIDAMSYWLREYDIDGFRVDAAGFVTPDFWREAVPAVRAAVRRPILLLAEWGDIEWNRLGFDLTYPWSSYGRLKAVWRGAPADGFVRSEVTDLQTMPPTGERMRFTTNHDETANGDPPVTLFRGADGARAAYVAMALLPGRPLLYNGQEVESPQVLGLFERQPVDWNQPHAAEARAFYTRIAHLATTDSSFVSGSFSAMTTDDSVDVIAYRRGAAVVLVNARDRAIRVAVSGLGVQSWRDVLSHSVQRGDTVSLPAYRAMVLEPATTTR